jgi:hypothetical protein
MKNTDDTALGEPLPELAGALIELLAAKGSVECGLHADTGLGPLLHLGLCVVHDTGQGRRRVTVTPAGRERWARIKAAAAEGKVTRTPMPADRLQKLREGIAARVAARRAAREAAE